MGLQPELCPSGGGSDANIFNKKGLPSAVLSVGMEKVHTVDEYILVKNFYVPAAEGAMLIYLIKKDFPQLFCQ